MKTVAVVLAGGVGVRVGLGIPKQLLKIAGKTVVEHTVERLNANDNIDEIIILMNETGIESVQAIADSGEFPKLTRVLTGGATRNDTTWKAIVTLGDEEVKVLFHDAVRPFVDDRILDECVAALDEFEAVDTAIPSADTIIQVNDQACISTIPDRSTLRRGQTPQGFRLSTIRRAYEIAHTDPNFKATDDCGVVVKYLPEVPVKVIDGSAENIKITEPLDIAIADKLFQLQAKSFPAHLDDQTKRELVGTRIVVLGGSYGIGASITEIATEHGSRVLGYSRSDTGTDVQSREAIREALADANTKLGGIDAIVLTAGVLTIASLAETPEEEIERTIRTNLIAPAIVAQEAYEYLRASKGSLLFFTSSSYTRGRSGYSLYSATKAGVVNLTQALAEEWSDDGVRVNCVNPQRTATPMRSAAFGEEPEGSLLSAERVANASLETIASDLTGQVVSVRLR